MTRDSASLRMRRAALCALLLLGLAAMHALPMTMPTVMPGLMVPEHLSGMKMTAISSESGVIPPMARDQHAAGRVHENIGPGTTRSAALDGRGEDAGHPCVGVVPRATAMAVAAGYGTAPSMTTPAVARMRTWRDRPGPGPPDLHELCVMRT